MRLRSTLMGVLICSVLLAGCTGDGADDASEPTAQTPTLVAPAEATMVVPGETPADIALATSQALFAQAPIAVLADDSDVAAQEAAAAFAVERGAPMLLAPAPPVTPAPSSSSTSAPQPSSAPTESAPTESVPTGSASPAAALGEIQRLGATTVVTYGAGAAVAAESLGDGITSVAGAADASGEEQDLPATEPAEPVESVLALATEASGRAAPATAQAAGADVRRVTGPDPRADRDLIAALAAEFPAHVIALGAQFGPTEQLAYRVNVASTGVELPGGGQVLYPYRRHVALYGNPTTPSLGALGEQPLAEAITRVQRLAAEYQQLADVPVVPTFEIITTVASSVADDDGNYSTESEPQDIRPYIDAAAQAGMHVVLDLQPGRTDFLAQAQRYEEFLKQPHVGLALDPEWRLGPNQVHLRQIGTVGAAEINSVVTWLADLTRDNNLPQKLLILHQFKQSMISERATVDTSRDELAVLVHVDGQGPTAAKFTTWNTLRGDPPPNVWWGWKNFTDKDPQMLTPAQTMAIDPVPYFISYQ
jgi:hypothetical protein